MPFSQEIDSFQAGLGHRFLTAGDCAAVYEKILSQRDRWVEWEVSKALNIRFHTLGAATYLMPVREVYHAERKKSAEALRAEFGGLYESLFARIEELTGVACVNAAELSPPGFHIYQGNEAAPTGLAAGGNIHLDLPHRLHYKASEVRHTLSVTVPIVLPSAGAGCYYWRGLPSGFQHGQAVPRDPAMLRWFDENKAFLAYETGTMVLHDGMTYHQLANPVKTTRTDWRITLQGHAVLLGDGKYHFFF